MKNILLKFSKLVSVFFLLFFTFFLILTILVSFKPIKINNFKLNENKSGYLYLLTPKGIVEKTKITLSFMKRKMKEYEELKSEIEKEKNDKL